MSHSTYRYVRWMVVVWTLDGPLSDVQPFVSKSCGRWRSKMQSDGWKRNDSRRYQKVTHESTIYHTLGPDCRRVKKYCR